MKEFPGSAKCDYTTIKMHVHNMLILHLLRSKMPSARSLAPLELIYGETYMCLVPRVCANLHRGFGHDDKLKKIIRLIQSLDDTSRRPLECPASLAAHLDFRQGIVPSLT
jgi:hypothetical protein